jgi:hypothetical protein
MKTAIDIKEYLESQKSLTDVHDEPIKVLIKTEGDTYIHCTECTMSYVWSSENEAQKCLIIG